MAQKHGVMCLKHFAAELEVSAITLKDLVEKHRLPTEKMLHGRAIGLSPATQKTLKRILNIKAERRPVSAA